MATPKYKQFPWVDFIKENVNRRMFTDETNQPMHFVLLIHDSVVSNGITKFIECCGGLVGYSTKNMNPYAAVLVNDSSNYWTYSGDVFKVSYIECCYHANRCLNISSFRKNVVSNLLPGFNYMDVISLKKYPWTRIPSKYMINLLQDDEYIFDDYDSSLDNSYTIEAQEGKYFITFPTSSDETDDDVNVLEINSENSEDDMNTEVGTDNVAKDLKATAMDCADNSNNESPERTFQHLNASRSNNDNVPENIASIFTCGQQRKINKHTRSSYSFAEKLAILQYIVDNEEYNRLRGNSLWKEMEAHKVCNKRTWQSMKEHFLKKVVFSLRQYKFLTSDQVRKIRWNTGKL